MKLEGSKTEANLIAALAGESQASVKYQLYAEKARQDGYEEMAQIFETTARNEKRMHSNGMNTCTAAKWPTPRKI